MYIRYYKEKDTDPMVFLQRFRCTTEPIGGGTEYDEEGELVSWDAAVAAIEIAMKQLGWHPASDPPIVPEHQNWISVVAIVCDMDDNSTRATDATFNKDKGWIFPEFSTVLYWCYPPKED